MFGLLFYAKNHVIYTCKYFESLNLKVIEIKSPGNSDWIKNPFRQKNKTWLGSIFRAPFDLTLLDYKIVIVYDKSELVYQVYWRQVSANVFFGGSIDFKKSIPLSSKEIEQLIPQKINVFEKCPACGSKVMFNDDMCPDCGLNFVIKNVD
jgi:hypothetical protein